MVIINYYLILLQMDLSNHHLLWKHSLLWGLLLLYALALLNGLFAEHSFFCFCFTFIINIDSKICFAFLLEFIINHTSLNLILLFVCRIKVNLNIIQNSHNSTDQWTPLTSAKLSNNSSTISQTKAENSTSNKLSTFSTKVSLDWKFQMMSRTLNSSR